MPVINDQGDEDPSNDVTTYVPALENLLSLSIFFNFWNSFGGKIMKILIIGNIGSGKTTLGNKIQELTGYKFVQIDKLRKEYLKNAVSEEYYCIYQFLKAIEKMKILF